MYHWRAHQTGYSPGVGRHEVATADSLSALGELFATPAAFTAAPLLGNDESERNRSLAPRYVIVTCFRTYGAYNVTHALSVERYTGRFDHVP